MRLRTERLAPLLMVALLAAAALYRVIDTDAAVSAALPAPPPPDLPMAETPTPKPPAVPVAQIALPPPPPMPKAAPAAPSAPSAPAATPRPALQPSPPAPQEPAVPARKALRPAPDPAPPKAAPPPTPRRTALVPQEPKPPAEPARRQALKPTPAPPPAARPAPAVKPALRPTPPPEPDPKPVARPAPAKPPARPQRHLAAAPAADPAPAPPVPDRAAVERAGRSLLRVLEHGQGPAVEIAWPDGAAARAALYRRLVDCHGMQVALLDRGGRLFGAAGAPGSPWAINMDRYSGFVRQAEGRITAAERAAADRIAARHRLPPSVSIVRVFPRGVDASLLGGLHGLLGQGYAQSAAIRGRYRLTGGRLLVSDITADGRPVPHPVVLSPARGGQCR